MRFPLFPAALVALSVFASQAIGQTVQSATSVPPGSSVDRERQFSNDEPRESPPAAPGSYGTSCGQSQHRAGPLYSTYLFSGEAYYEETDLHIEGRGIDFNWGRKYRSKQGPDTAMGKGWDYSYNIRVEALGPHLWLMDGNTRRDFFRKNGYGTWHRDGFFLVIEQDPADGTYVATFPDTGTWHFNALDGSPEAGRISAIRDRNENQLSFSYDIFGQLKTITDSLNRDITIAYGPNGYIETVTDFLGREVRYTHYQTGDADGSAGDLKSVRSPIVVGTPNGNDFPSGKTTTYTYSKGFSDPRLNHNLLTVTDPKGQTWLTNEYDLTTNPRDLEFDRVVRQTWGDPGDVLDVHYERVPTPGGVELLAVTNDRVGNVHHYSFDAKNRLVRKREFTGRANPDQPTTLSANLPTGKLRLADPDWFETTYSWNEDHLLTRVIHPNGNSTERVYERDLHPPIDEWDGVYDPHRLTLGNLREIRHLPGPLGGDQPEIVEYFEYYSGTTVAGGCACGTDFVAKHTDGRGFVTTHDYDANWNRTRTIRPIQGIRDEWEYNSAGQMTAHLHPDNGSGHRRRDEWVYVGGYQKESIVDAGGMNLKISYDRDSLGRVIRSVDRRGVDALMTWNALDQVVREFSREVTPGGVRYMTETVFDENDNEVRIDVENRDETGALRPNAILSTSWDYDILNYELRETQEVSDQNSVVTENEYDANRDLLLRRKGEATNGNSPGNVVFSFPDERRLPWRKTQGDGSGASTSTTQYDYDGNGNLVKLHQGLESGSPHVSANLFDGYDRRVGGVDPMGNSHTAKFDAHGNMTWTRIEGELNDVLGDTNNVRLSETTFVFDSANRLVRRERAFFDPETQAPISDGLSVEEFAYTDTSQVKQVVDDSGDSVFTEYDDAMRKAVVTDAKGNTTTYVYDVNNNVTAIVSVELSDLGAPAEQFVWLYEYDGQNREILAADNANNTTSTGWDSLDNATLVVDALGNVTRRTYDGIGRLIQTTRELTDTGTGSGNITGVIENHRFWDDSSRLVGQQDGRGNLTQYFYDDLDRMVAVMNADGTTNTQTYDAHHNTVGWIDENGTVVTNMYDLNNRLVDRSIAPGVGVSNDTTFELREWDGLGRVVSATDDDSAVSRSYDSLSHLTEETLNGRTTSASYNGVGNLMVHTYPSGRVILRFWDELNRLKAVTDPGSGETIAVYDYKGPSRVEHRVYPTMSAMTAVHAVYEYGPAKDITRISHFANPGGLPGVVNDLNFTWDGVHNKTSRTDLVPGGWSHQYEYDSAYRMVHSLGTAVGNPGEESIYAHDGAHNRIGVGGDVDMGIYLLDNTMPEPADGQMNQYSHTPWDDREYDRAGNMVNATPAGSPQSRQLGFDYRNRLVSHVNPASAQTVTFGYDVFGRRTSKVVDDGVTQQTDRFSYGLNGWQIWQVIEDQDASGNTLATYVHGRAVDELLQMVRGGVSYYYHADDLGNVMSITDGAGAVTDRYKYGDYGKPTNLGVASSGNPYLFNGRRYDAETGLYYYRTRYLDTRAGRFISRDSIGAWGDKLNLGNASAYVGANPWSRTDPSGQASVKRTKTCPSGKKIKFKFWDLSSARRTELMNAGCGIHEAAKNARRDVKRLLGGWGSQASRDATLADLKYWFQGTSSSLTTARREKIETVLKKVRNKLVSGDRIKIEGEKNSHFMCNGTTRAFVLWPSKHMHTCPEVWKSKYSDNVRAGVLFHEMTHAYASTSDKGYYLGKVAGKPVWTKKDDGTDDELNATKLTKNADTYEEYLRREYGPLN